MPPATFKSEETKQAFYEKTNKQVMERYYDDPEFRQKKLEARKALYKKHKELGIGRFSPEGIERQRLNSKLRYKANKIEKNAVVVVAV